LQLAQNNIGEDDEVEGLNYKVNTLVRKAFGFRSFDVIETALYHQLGNLPEPEMEHRLW